MENEQPNEIPQSRKSFDEIPIGKSKAPVMDEYPPGYPLLN